LTARDEEALDLARAAGDLLLARQEVTSSAGAAWRSNGGSALAGMAHGATGCARALAALARATGERRYAVGAAAALGHERALFDADRGNWPVLARGPRGERRLWMVAWCHGAAGIALGRLFLPPEFNDATSERELEAALTTVATAPPAPLAHLCCGQLGRAWVLLSAALRRGRPELAEAALVASERVVARAVAEQGFRLRRDTNDRRAPDGGFLKGLSGIGYHFLRLADPFSLPDVLAFELPGEEPAGAAGGAR